MPALMKRQCWTSPDSITMRGTRTPFTMNGGSPLGLLPTCANDSSLPVAS